MNPGKSSSGLSLIELLVSILIISILAGITLPYAEMTIRRNKELGLQQSLREIRIAIDRFHQDWSAARLPSSSDAVSADGYPKSLDLLVEGVDSADALGKRRYYLRRIPRNPFATADAAVEEHWVLRSYQDEPDASSWGGQDVYDISSSYAGDAIDGSNYADW